MKVYLSGYITKSKKIENIAIKTVEEYAPSLLGHHIEDIKSIRLEFLKRHIDWTGGYKWLWNEDLKEVKITVPGGYREWSKWLTFHELCHVRQILDGRVRMFDNPHVLYYQYPSKNIHDVFLYQQGTGWLNCQGHSLARNELPWECEVLEMEKSFNMRWY